MKKEAASRAASVRGWTSRFGDSRLRLCGGRGPSQLCRHREIADLLSHVFSGFGRKAIMETGIDAGVRDLVAVILQARPFSRDTGSGWARQCDFADVVAGDALQNGGNG